MSIVRFACLILMSVAYGTTPKGDVKVVGGEEIVFDWTTDRCSDDDIPDLPARAFRDADGKVQLIATHHVNRRMIGETLNTVKHDCRVIMKSHNDPRWYHFNDKEWLTAVYTLDGKTVYALVHNEYQGNTHKRARCKTGDYLKCWYNAITFARSENGGRSYSHARSPSHLVACAPYPYEPDTGPWGIFGGGNIIHNPTDGYYYTMLHLEKRFLQEWGVTLMRTRTLHDPRSWRGWGGSDWTVQFINPHTNKNAHPAQHICQPIARDQIEKMHESLTYNTYFKQYVLVGASGQYDPATKRPVHGFYFARSDDLIHWTDRKLIMEAKLPWTPDLPGEVILYPSLLDPEDTSRNFERTGRRPYLYYTRMHPATPENNGLDRDLVRVPIEFE